MDVKQRIKSILKQNDLSIYGLATKADLSTACINNWYGKRGYEPSLSALQKIGDALEIPLSQLLYDGDNLIPADDLLSEFFDAWILLTPEQRQALTDTAKSMVVDKDIK